MSQDHSEKYPVIYPVLSVRRARGFIFDSPDTTPCRDGVSFQRRMATKLVSFFFSTISPSKQLRQLRHVSAAMPARQPTIYWLRRKSTSVYGRKRHL